MSIFGLPLILFRVKAGGDDEMSDLQFLAIKEFTNKRTDVDDQVTIVNSAAKVDLVTKTTSSGKDGYLGSAVASFIVTATPNNTRIRFELSVDGVIVEIKRFDEVLVGGTGTYEFITKGNKSIPLTGIIKIAVVSSNAIETGVVADGKLVLWEENTGATPQEPPLNPV